MRFFSRSLKVYEGVAVGRRVRRQEPGEEVVLRGLLEDEGEERLAEGVRMGQTQEVAVFITVILLTLAGRCLTYDSTESA